MKLIQTFILLIAVSLTAQLNAQIDIPAASPSAKLTQEIGLTKVTVEYARPSMKERTIFAPNGLVPFGEMWRTGANQATKITFSNDVKIQGNDLAKGSYAVTTVPTATEWTFNFYTYEKSNWGTYKEKEPNLSVKASPVKIPVKIETFLINFDKLTNEGAVMEFLWEDTWVSLEIAVTDDERIMKDIENTLAGPAAGDYYTAAVYYHDAKKDLNKALEWVQKATSVEKPKFWQVRREALILADLGKMEKAIEVAKKSKELAIAADYQPYVKLNDESIAMWTKKLKK